MAEYDFPSGAIDSFVVDFKPNFEQASSKFRFWQVESLLNKAADLLDRCLAEQARYGSLRAQQAVLEGTLRAEEDSVSIEELLRDRGQYDYPITDAKSRVSNLTAIKNDYQNAAYWASQTYEQDKTAGNAAFMHDHSITNHRFLMELAVATEELRRAEEDNYGTVGIRKEKILRERARLVEKKDHMKPSGALNFAEEATKSIARFNRDYQEALDRLTVASTGLETIYGYRGYFDNTGILVDFLSSVKLVNNGNISPIDAAVTWTREAIRWLSAFSHRDQAVTVVTSIKQSLGTHWPKLFSDPKPQLFSIDTDLFSTYRHARLRGMCATFITKDGTSNYPIRCIISVPKSAKYFILGDDIAHTSESAVDQGDAPPCVLGRVADKRLSREPEICGAVSLMNVSPIGDSGQNGLFTIQAQRTIDSDVAEIEDILLELLVSVQPAHTI